MKISEIFNLNRKQNELDFVDIDTENDMPLFLDPYFLAIREDRWSQIASRTLNDFFQHIVMLFREGRIEDAKRKFHFMEPYETCLGLSKEGVMGKGIGNEEATTLFQYIIDSGIFEDDLLSSISDIKIFVDNISHDKISDLCTNVIRRHLIAYTQRQCELYNIPMEDNIATLEYWDSESHQWNVSYERMLVINEKPILLIPKSIVCRKRGFFYDSDQYARHFVLNFLVSEELRTNSKLVHTRILRGGRKKQFVIKDEVAKKHGAYKKEFLREFTREKPIHFENFKNSAKGRLSSLSNEEILEDYSDDLYISIIDKLILEFSSISSGANDASNFHDHIIACINFLFYPNLIDPQKEREIHDGRKRIDISYDNASNKGYFFNLSNVKQIPCQYICVECKNYSKDVANPELDQLNGRFSPNRGKVGFMVFRSCENKKLLLARCRDHYKDNRNLIIPLQDKDFIEMLNSRKNNTFERGSAIAEEHLRRMTEKIIVS